MASTVIAFARVRITVGGTVGISAGIENRRLCI